MLKRVVLLRRVTFGTILAVAGYHSKEPSLLEVNVHAGNLDGQLVLKQSLSGRETIINTPDKESLVQLSRVMIFLSFPLRPFSSASSQMGKLITK